MSLKRWVAVGVALVVVAGAGCSSSDPEAFELDHPMMPPEVPFTAVGAAVDGGMLCGDGMWVAERMENAQGEEIQFEQWADVFDEAVSTDGVAEATSYKEFRCADGSGMLLIEDHTAVDFSEVDIETFGSGRVQFGAFEITGTDDYESLSGSGDVFTDFDGEQIAYVGEATN